VEYNQSIIEVIQDRHYCTDWLHNYSTNVYIIIQHGNQIQQITISTSAATRWYFHRIKPAHKCTHQTINVHCIKPTELTTESYQKKSWSAWYPHIPYCTSPVAVSCTPQTFSIFCLSLQFIHLFDEVSETFLFSNKLFLKYSLCRCHCSGEAYRDTDIFQKKGVAADLGLDLAMGEAKDLGNNISTCHWFVPINNRFCSYSFYSFL